MTPLIMLALVALGDGKPVTADTAGPVEVEYSSMLVLRDDVAVPGPLPEAKWEQVPRPADFRGIDRSRLVSTGQVEANCELGENRRLRRCIYTGPSPGSPPMMALYKRAAARFRVALDTPFLREGRIERVVVYFIVKVPGARETGVERCLPLRCTAIPGPPDPPAK